jgi:hypothetical protein
MPLYRISHKIKTVATLDQPVEVNGFRLERFDPPNYSSGAWTATEDYQATDVATAVNESRQRVMALADALAIVLQCSFSPFPHFVTPTRPFSKKQHDVVFRAGAGSANTNRARFGGSFAVAATT